MIINIKVIPNAKKSRIDTCPLPLVATSATCRRGMAGEGKGEGILKVYLKSPPVDGKANKELIEVLAEHFKVKKSSIEIIRGQASRNKVIKIP